MVRSKCEQTVIVNENMRGGDGKVMLTHLLNKEEMNEKGRLFAKIILKPGCSIGYHTHENESETYYLQQGSAEYDDNGVSVTLNPGDVTYTPAGSGHAIANRGDTDVELVALILF